MCGHILCKYVFCKFGQKDGRNIYQRNNFKTKSFSFENTFYYERDNISKNFSSSSLKKGKLPFRSKLKYNESRYFLNIFKTK